MSVLDEILALLGLTGRQHVVVLDTVGEPVDNVDVRVVDPTGTVLDTVRTGADGSLGFTADVTRPAPFDLVVDPLGPAVTVRVAEPTDDLQVFTVRRPVRLQGTVGFDGANQPRDLRRVQDQLQYAGRLTDADVAAEPLDPVSTTAVDAADVPLLMAALDAHLRAGGGGPATAVGPTGWELDLLNVVPDVPPLLTAQDDVTGWVGDAPGRAAGAVPPHNQAPQVRRVQERLLQLGFLSRADYATERVGPAAASPVPEAGLPRTVAAIARFNEKVVGSFQHAVFSGFAEERLIRDPPHWGRLPLRLGSAVGPGGGNAARDVRAVQDRLHELELLSDADHAAELVALPAPGSADPLIDVTTLPRTLAAIRTAHVRLLGAAPPGPDLVPLTDPGLDRLNQPPPVAIAEVGDEQPPVSRPAVTTRMNHPRHVRAVQDRLRLLGYLSDLAHDIERVNPRGRAAVPSQQIGNTLAAIRAVQADLGIAVAGQRPGAGGESLLPTHRPSSIQLGDGVGQGQPNRPADVRPIQDRLLALRFLSAADHQAERVDPAAANPPGAIPRTLAAISAMRQRIFGLPPAGADPWTAVPVVTPGSEALRFLNDPLFFGRPQIALTASVGELGGNRPDDLRPVQQRLRELGLLTAAELAAETPAAPRRGRMHDDELPATIVALRRLRGLFLGEVPDVARVEARHPALLALDRPYERQRVRLDLTGSVGTGGANDVDDVRRVQDRLRDLRVLGRDDHELESSRLATPVNLAVLPRTVAAITQWQRLHSGAMPPLTPFGVGLRRLEWPRLPIPDALTLGHEVGAGAGGANRNRRDDVLAVQRRLHVLGLLTTAAYLRERRVVRGLATVNAAQVPDTVAAIRTFQQTAAGGTDGIISPGGHTERVLRDPAFGTPAPTNPDAANRDAGPGMPAQWHPNNARHREIVAVIEAIEAHEAGGSSGEVPAVLRNGSAVPASYGKAQMIAATAVDTLRNEPGTADFYALTPAEVAAVAAALVAANTEYDRIFGLVPVGGLTEANLAAAIAADLAPNGAGFRAATGLGPETHERMFRTAQLRRRSAAFIAAQAGPNDAARRVNAVANVANLVNHADTAPTVTALGMRRADVAAFLDRAIDNEHRGGFMTHVLFRLEDGLAVKAAMTDDSGFKLGRFLIRANFVQVLNSPGGAALTRQQRAQITARIHNSGPGGLAGFVAAPATAVNAYVNNVMPHWVDPGP